VQRKLRRQQKCVRAKSRWKRRVSSQWKSTVFAFVAQRATEPPVHATAANEKGSVIRFSGVRILVLLLAAMGTIVGTVDVVSVAFAEQQGQPAAASLVLSVPDCFLEH